MKKDLLNKLQIWEQNGILGTRKYEELSRSFKEGESLITLSISLSIRFNGGKITIIVKRPFHTFAQNDGNLNSKGDIYLFNKIVECLENDLINKYNNVLNKIL